MVNALDLSTSDVTILELGPSFLRHLRTQNFAVNTIVSYGEALKQYQEYSTANGLPLALASVRREHIELWIEYLLDRRSPATANNRFRGLQQFWKWAVEEGEVRGSPMANLKPPRIPETVGSSPTSPTISTELRAFISNWFCA